MADRGRKKLPEGMKVIDGSGRPNAETRGKRSEGTLPDPPDHIPELGKAFWDDVAPVLNRMGVGTEGDKWTLESMAVLYAHYRSALRHVEEHGTELLHEKKGTWVKNPALVTVQQNLDSLRIWFNEVGLTPSARAKLGAAAEARGEDNPFREFA